VFDIVLTSAERTLLEALNALSVQYLIVGMGAAAKRPKDTAQLPMLEAALQALRSRGKPETGR